MAKVVLFENTKVESKLVVDEKGTLAKRYADMLLVAIDTPPAGGFTPKANVDATALYDRVNEVKEDSVIEFTVSDYNAVKASMENLRFPKRSSEIAEITEYVNGLKPETKVKKEEEK